MGKILGLVIAVIVIFGIIMAAWWFGTYNRLVGLDENVNEAWSQVENVYQRRMDLVPNLVETVKGVANFERDTYTAVAEARSQAGQVKMSADILKNPRAFQAFEQSQGALSSALSRLLVTVERYPELKASANFAELQNQLEGTENRIAVERRRFNEVARTYNTGVRRFPTRIIAAIAGFDQRPYFEASEGAERAPQVKF